MFEYNGINGAEFDDILISYLFLFKKFYYDLCIKFYLDFDNFMFKIYFVKKNKNYNIILVYKDIKVNIINTKNFYVLDFKEFINYFKRELNLNINNIKLCVFSF